MEVPSPPGRPQASGIEIREALDAERTAACRRVFAPPGPEARGIAGSEDRARRLGEALFELGLLVGEGDRVFGAFEGDRCVGVLVLETPEARRAPRPPLPWRALLSRLLAIFGRSGLPRLAWRGVLRSRLGFPVPGDALHVVELHVDPGHQGRGIGGRLLARAEAEARSLGLAALVLSTLTTNPARRLYERMGYRVTAERRVPGYQAITGSPGRVRMEKRLRDRPLPGRGRATGGSRVRGESPDPRKLGTFLQISLLQRHGPRVPLTDTGARSLAEIDPALTPIAAATRGALLGSGDRHRVALSLPRRWRSSG